MQTTAATLTNMGAAASGANSDITSLSGLTMPLSTSQGGTGSSVQNFVDLTNTQNVGGAKTFTSPMAITASGTTAALTLSQTGTGPALSASNANANGTINAPVIAVSGSATASSGNSYGVYGTSASNSGYGVYGKAAAATGTTSGYSDPR